MNSDMMVLNFSGIYESESFYREDKGSFYDLSDIAGTNCMCDDFAKAEILRRIGDSYNGLHFIDSGNYHYMSAIFTGMISEPFSLVVLDHHPDMQPPAFGNILSCGGWILDVIDNNRFVRDIHIIGADEMLISQVDERYRERVRFYNVNEIFGDNEERALAMAAHNRENAESEKGDCIIPRIKYPVYLSIDKDVISRDELATNWDQGEASIRQVLDFAEALANSGNRLLGVDVCGEPAPGQEDIDLQKQLCINDDFNRKISKLFRFTLEK